MRQKPRPKLLLNLYNHKFRILEPLISFVPTQLKIRQAAINSTRNMNNFLKPRAIVVIGNYCHKNSNRSQMF